MRLFKLKRSHKPFMLGSLTDTLKSRTTNSLSYFEEYKSKFRQIDVSKYYFCLGYMSNLLTTLYASDLTQ